MTVLYM